MLFAKHVYIHLYKALIRLTICIHVRTCVEYVHVQAVYLHVWIYGTSTSYVCALHADSQILWQLILKSNLRRTSVCFNLKVMKTWNIRYFLCTVVKYVLVAKCSILNIKKKVYVDGIKRWALLGVSFRVYRLFLAIKKTKTLSKKKLFGLLNSGTSLLETFRKVTNIFGQKLNKYCSLKLRIHLFWNRVALSLFSFHFVVIVLSRFMP